MLQTLPIWPAIFPLGPKRLPFGLQIFPGTPNASRLARNFSAEPQTVPVWPPNFPRNSKRFPFGSQFFHGAPNASPFELPRTAPLPRGRRTRVGALRAGEPVATLANTPKIAHSAPVGTILRRQNCFTLVFGSTAGFCRPTESLCDAAGWFFRPADASSHTAGSSPRPCGRFCGVADSFRTAANGFCRAPEGFWWMTGRFWERGQATISKFQERIATQFIPPPKPA
jgi:hypothetical protein